MRGASRYRDGLTGLASRVQAHLTSPQLSTMSFRSTALIKQSLGLIDRRAGPAAARWTASPVLLRNQSNGSRPPKPIDDSTSALDCTYGVAIILHDDS